MITYSIKDLEHLSGIKAHTLRIWEQRYNFIKPKRTQTNIRFYDDDDLKLILNISLLKENGFKISKIAEMNADEIYQHVMRITQKDELFPAQIHSLTLAMLELDEERFEKAISTSILQIGFEKTMLNIIFPFLSRIGILWQTGAAHPAHEHFISHLIRQKLMVANDGQVVSENKKSQKYMLFLPEGELHELGLLFASYLIKSRNNRVIYLGPSLPFADLNMVYQLHKPKYLVSIITSSLEPSQVQSYISKIGETFSDAEVLLSGTQVVAQDLNPPANVKIFSRIDRFISFIEDNK